jgi:predicted RNase H-like HicB family nuclease
LRLMRLTVEFDREADGRWIAEVPELAGVLAYGETREAALQNVKAVALETMIGLAELGEREIDDVIEFRAA